MALSRDLRPALTPLRLTLAIALLAVASSGYVVFVAHNDTPLPLEAGLVSAPQQLPFRMSNGGQRGSVSFATPSP